MSISGTLARSSANISPPGGPVISLDTKKKELVVGFKNGGWEWKPAGHPVEAKGKTETKCLGSLTPREKVAHAWSNRGNNLRANACLKEAVDCFATECSIVTHDRLLDL